LCLEIDGTPVLGIDDAVKIRFSNSDASGVYENYVKPGHMDGDCRVLDDWWGTRKKLEIGLDSTVVSDGPHVLNVSLHEPDYVYETAFKFTSTNGWTNPFPNTFLSYKSPNLYYLDAYDAYFGYAVKFHFSGLSDYKKIPETVAFEAKVNGAWKSLGNRKSTVSSWESDGSDYESPKSIILNQDTWIRIRVTRAGHSWLAKYLVKPKFYLEVKTPSKVIVGKSGVAKLIVPSLSSAKCGVQVVYQNFQGKTVRTQDYAVYLRNGSTQITAKMNATGSVNGKITCYPANKQVLEGSFSWIVSYG
jgi:hypothetical protein